MHASKKARLNALDGLEGRYELNPKQDVMQYFNSPQAKYFGIGKIDKDQVADYARRKGWDIATAERWLAPVLGYRRK